MYRVSYPNEEIEGIYVGDSYRETGLNVVALSGGCFANRYVTSRLSANLASEGFEVLRHRRVPCNDAGVALGQAAVAAARKRASRRAESSRMDPNR